MMIPLGAKVTFDQGQFAFGVPPGLLIHVTVVVIDFGWYSAKGVVRHVSITIKPLIGLKLGHDLVVGVEALEGLDNDWLMGGVQGFWIEEAQMKGVKIFSGQVRNDEHWLLGIGLQICLEHLR